MTFIIYPSLCVLLVMRFQKKARHEETVHYFSLTTGWSWSWNSWVNK